MKVEDMKRPGCTRLHGLTGGSSSSFNSTRSHKVDTDISAGATAAVAAVATPRCSCRAVQPKPPGGGRTPMMPLPAVRVNIPRFRSAAARVVSKDTTSISCPANSSNQATVFRYYRYNKTSHTLFVASLNAKVSLRWPLQHHVTESCYYVARTSYTATTAEEQRETRQRERSQRCLNFRESREITVKPGMKKKKKKKTNCRLHR